MSVMIRMARQGRKKDPQYMIVAATKACRRDGRFLEKLGYYFPKKAEDKAKIELNEEAYINWLKKGAQVSQSVDRLVRNAGLRPERA